MPMNITFDSLVDILRNLTIDEKIEIKDIIDKSIIEQKREMIYHNYKKALNSYSKGKCIEGSVDDLLDGLK